MQNKKRSVLTPAKVFTYGIIVKNPVLVQVIGLCPAVAASADIFVSTLLSLLVIALLVVCECFASLFLKRVPRTIRVGLYFLIGLVLCTGVTYALELNMPELLNRSGVYLALMAASSAVALRSETFAVKKSLRLSFLDALANGIGTALVLLSSGFVRGLLGTGKIGDITVFRHAPLQGLAMPFGGFIVLGFSAAFLKWFISEFLTQFDANMDFGIQRKKKKKRPVAKRPVKAAASEAVSGESQEPQSAKAPAVETEQSTSGDSQEEVNAESHAQSFYELAAEDALPELDDALFSVDEILVQADLDEILKDIASFESILGDAGKEDDNA